MPRLLSLAAVAVVALGEVASAATKHTPALSKNSTDLFVCRIANVGTVPISGLQIQIIGSNGALLGQSTVNVPDSWTASAVYAGTATIGYCRVDGAFPRKKVLVTFCTMLSGSQRCEVAVGDGSL